MEQKIAFNVLGQLTDVWEPACGTQHYKNERTGRTSVINQYIGYGNDVIAFMVDTKHPNGNEVHVLTDTGIIKIYNARTGKHINDLIARPGQIRRYFPDGKVPYECRDILDIARAHQNAGYNIC